MSVAPLPGRADLDRSRDTVALERVRVRTIVHGRFTDAPAGAQGKTTP
jgi:hypothetical protein